MEPVAAIATRRDPGGAWEFAERPPAPRLRGLVDRCVGFRERSAAPCRRREVPGGQVTLVVSFGDPYAVAPAPAGPALSPPPAGSPEAGCRPLSGFLARVSPRPALTEFAGATAGVQLDLSPSCARMLVGLPLEELPEPAVGLADLLGPEADLLAEELAELPDWAARLGRVEGFLERRLAAAAPPAPSVEWAWSQLRASGGQAGIGALAARLGCSRRHLVAGFRDLVGVPPKTAAEILRFERAARLLRRPAPIQGEEREGTFGRLAAECGYYDQSHMTREFRRFAGTTPTRFARAAGAGSLGVDEDQVTSVQDAAAAAA